MPFDDKTPAPPKLADLLLRARQDRPTRAQGRESAAAIEGIREKALARHRKAVERREHKQALPEKPVLRANPVLLEKPAALEKPALPAGILLPLPQRAPQKSHGTLISFLIVVILPVILSAIYYFGIASSQYVAEFRFAVRDAKTAAASGDPSANLIGLVTSSGGGSAPLVLENYMAINYLVSDDAVLEIEKRLGIRKLYSRPDIDWYSRLDPTLPLEGLVAYWKQMVRATYDQVTGSATVQVRAFSAEDAQRIAVELTKMAEQLITEVARRPQLDAVRFAEQDLERVQNRLKTVSAELTQYRDTERVIEPNSNVVQSNTQLAATLRGNLSALQTELSALSKQNLGPTAPARQVLESRIKAAKEQLSLVENEVGTPRVDGKSLSRVVSRYEELDLARQFASDTVKASLQNLETARANALIQHMYVTTFIKPVLPQSPTRPLRLVSVLLTALVCVLIWSAGMLLFRSVREHIA